MLLRMTWPPFAMKSFFVKKEHAPYVIKCNMSFVFTRRCFRCNMDGVYWKHGLCNNELCELACTAFSERCLFCSLFSKSERMPPIMNTCVATNTGIQQKPLQR